MTTQPKTVTLYPGFKGFVSGVVNASYAQKAFMEVKKEGGATIASATFEGQGSRVYMKDVFNNKTSWSFGPFNYKATLYITITNSSVKPSKVVGPLSIEKAPEADYPMRFYVSTVISEDGADASHDDCTITVLQYN